jgi:2-keto-4-pentenoate hydratase
MRGLEGEFAFKLARDLKPRAKPYRLAEVKAAIGSVHPAIEIIGPRWTNMLAVGVPSLIADLGANGALLLGAALRGGAKLDLRKIGVRMLVDGAVVGQGSGADVLGDPYESLLWLANHLRRSEGLKAGQVVTTGTCTGIAKAPAKAKVVAEFGGRAGVSLTFT